MGKQTTTSTTSADKVTLGREAQTWKAANALPSTLPTYGGEMTAGTTDQSQLGFDQVKAAAQSAQPGIAQAQGLLAQGYTPQQITAMGYNPTTAAGGQDVTAQNIGLGGAGGGAYQPGQVSAGTVTANTFPGANLSAYMNPYIQNVVDATGTDIERQRQQAIAQGQAQATAAGAYGGSRHGVSDSLTNEAAGRTQAMSSGQLRSAGFTQAQNAISNDQNREFQASDANARYGLQAGIANQGAGLQAADLGLRGAMANQSANLQAGMANQDNARAYGLFNADAANQAGQFGAAATNRAAEANQNAGLQGAQLEQSRAGMIADTAIAGQTAGLQGANANYQAGAAQQNTNQAAMDAAYQQWQNQQKFPYEYQQFLQGFRGTPGQVETTVQPNQLPGQILGGVMSLGAGLLGGGGGGGGGMNYQTPRVISGLPTQPGWFGV